MSDQPTLYRVIGGMLLNNDFEGRKVWITPGGERTYATLGRMVPVEPTEHQHQWLPWLTLPNGSSWTQCVPCGEQFQYDQR